MEHSKLPSPMACPARWPPATLTETANRI
jgi:hypothetical protein